jgi:CMP-N-acetylneuraminic acid synthetase
MPDETGLVVIPVRGGSKRLPGKHERLLGQRTILEIAAETLSQETEKFPVLLTTDSSYIASNAKNFDWLAPLIRPAELATDTATTVDTVLHALGHYEESTGQSPELLFVFQTTSPFRPVGMISAATKVLRQNPQIDAIVGASKSKVFAQYHFTAMPLRMAPRIGTHPSENEAVFTPNGTIYAIRTSVFKNEKSFFPNKLGGLVTDHVGGTDIDTIDDWHLAEVFMQTGRTGRLVETITTLNSIVSVS